MNKLLQRLLYHCIIYVGSNFLENIIELPISWKHSHLSKQGNFTVIFLKTTYLYWHLYLYLYFQLGSTVTLFSELQ